ncbi:hypothetical protein EDD15DRAFT_2194774 [Pisolithus albus]|nr:hypothetical protein EDD15DRAFT_2194774 [Pisolithus albus]
MSHVLLVVFFVAADLAALAVNSFAADTKEVKKCVPVQASKKGIEEADDIDPPFYKHAILPWGCVGSGPMYSFNAVTGVCYVILAKGRELLGVRRCERFTVFFFLMWEDGEQNHGSPRPMRDDLSSRSTHGKRERSSPPVARKYHTCSTIDCPVIRGAFRCPIRTPAAVRRVKLEDLRSLQLNEWYCTEKVQLRCTAFSPSTPWTPQIADELRGCSSLFLSTSVREWDLNFTDPGTVAITAAKKENVIRHLGLPPSKEHRSALLPHP